jgi:hypothetical protein
MQMAVAPLGSLHPSGEIWGKSGHPVAPDRLAFAVGSKGSTFIDHGMRWDKFRQERAIGADPLVELIASLGGTSRRASHFRPAPWGWSSRQHLQQR